MITRYRSFCLDQGDQALATVGSSLRNSLRQTDVVARVGGDEFAILMPETTADAVQTVLPKLQSSLLEEGAFQTS